MTILIGGLLIGGACKGWVDRLFYTPVRPITYRV